MLDIILYNVFRILKKGKERGRKEKKKRSIIHDGAKIIICSTAAV